MKSKNLPVLLSPTSRHLPRVLGLSSEVGPRHEKFFTLPIADVGHT